MEYYSNPNKSDENDEMVIFSQTTNKSEDQKKGEKLAFELVQKVSFAQKPQPDALIELKYFRFTDGWSSLCF